jgi:hypothetical protein
MAWACALLFFTTLPGPPNGIPSSIVCSARSAGTGLLNLDSYQKALRLIRTTTTTTGLKLTAQLDTTYYPTGVKPSTLSTPRAA